MKAEIVAGTFANSATNERGSSSPLARCIQTRKREQPLTHVGSRRNDRLRLLTTDDAEFEGATKRPSE